jgi:hypothetical protein
MGTGLRRCGRMSSYVSSGESYECVVTLGCPFWAEAQLGDGLFAHQKFLDLAGYRHRKGVDEFDVARDLVMGDLPLAESADLFGGRGHAAAQPDPGAQLFAIARTLLAIEFSSTCLGKATKRIEELFVVSHLEKVRKQLIWLRI